MGTVERFSEEEITGSNHFLSPAKVTIETAFYRNNAVLVSSRREAYKLAKNSPGTIILDWKVYKPHLLDLDEDTHVLLFNDGAVVGRYAKGRRIIGTPGVDSSYYLSIIREAIYNTRYRKMYHAVSFTGLHEDFMVKNHLLIPEGHENLLYNWLLNFQHETPEYSEMYKRSKKYNEPDTYIFSDPDWKHPDFPMGLVIFDPVHNVAAILGMRYFGEFKKATLTLGWGTASRNGYVACHGGLKKFEYDGKSFVAAFFGLSGSGKSTLTHAKHKGKYNITVLHDDAFIINLKDKSSIALEPQYFDKTADYTTSSEDNRYLLTIQNCGATLTKNGKIVPVMEDIRNGNGRAIKSRLWSPNRVDKIDEPIDAIFWIMKDPALPPVIKIEDPTLASAMGATLATKRTSAEAGVDTSKLVIEPYANPFRTWVLNDDFVKFKKLFENGVSCYVINTGHFMDKKVPKEVTLSIIESIVEGKAAFKDFVGPIKYMKIEGFEVKCSDEYKKALLNSFRMRLEYLEENSKSEGINHISEDAAKSMEKMHKEIKKLIKEEARWGN